MKGYLIAFGITLLTFTSTLRADSPIAIVLDKHYSKTGGFELNGRRVDRDHDLRALSDAIHDNGRNKPVIVLIPLEASFADWNAIKGLIGKVGFLNDRYFVYSSKTGMMIELNQAHRAIPFSLNPGLR
jgi:hypothetical protein